MSNRKPILRLAILVIAMGISGCSTSLVVPFDTGGSRADGIITMTALLGDFDTVDWKAGEVDALYRCRQWGYSRAEAFSGVTVDCVNTYCGQYGCYCTKEQVSRNYQCIE